MVSLQDIRRGVLFAALASLVGCSGTFAPRAPGMLNSVGPPRPEQSLPWMAPEAKSEDLLYISTDTTVDVFSYPKGTLVGELTGFASPAGLCTDRAGDVFVTDTTEYGRVYEFAHGGTQPIRTFYDDYVALSPYDCSIDPVTGNLAVVSVDAWYIVIFPHARNSPQLYDDPYASLFWCAYDSKGNLYVDQVRHRGRQYIGVLPKGSATFKNFLLDRRVGDAGGLQFDGRHVVLDDLHADFLYRLRFSGSNATVVGSTQIDGYQSRLYQFWIYKRRVIGPVGDGTVYFWRYPVGGSPIKSIPGLSPVGSTVSAGATPRVRMP